MANVLVTGFGAFGTTPTNPAKLTAEALDGRVIAGWTVVSRDRSQRVFRIDQRNAAGYR